MLCELRIRDVAIIEDVAVDLGPGLNVLSGETGAGKSIILGALGLVLGGRAGAEWVRTGRPSAEVQARFDRDPELEAVLGELDVALPDDEEGVLVRRVVTAAGRSRAYIGSVAVPVSALRRVAAVLVDYASQHEHQVLLDETSHEGILDRFGVPEPALREARSFLAELRGLLAEQVALDRRARDRAAREDYLRYQLEELDEADLQPGEEEELEAERVVLRNAVALSEKARRAEAALYSGGGSAVERIGDAAARLRELVAVDAAMAAVLASVQEALFAVEEAGRDLHTYASKTREDPGRLQEVEDRLALVHSLQRKHRRSFEGLLELRGRMRAELDELEGSEHRSTELARLAVDARARARRATAAVTEARRAAAERLAAAVETELQDLGMARARFSVRVDPVEPGGEAVALGEDGPPYALSGGADRVAFQLAANPGEEARPLARVASGGELSRILLSIRRALAGAGAVQVQVCVFDEVDSGLGGTTADRVAAKLEEIAGDGQVLVITHLPQIAARGAHHFQVRKEVVDGRTFTRVERLEGAARVEELVRMVGGSQGAGAARQFARELLVQGRTSPAGLGSVS